MSINEILNQNHKSPEEPSREAVLSNSREVAPWMFSEMNLGILSPKYSLVFEVKDSIASF